VALALSASGRQGHPGPAAAAGIGIALSPGSIDRWNQRKGESTVPILLWLLGVPFSVIIILWLLGVFS
jgi:hypothetical protein